MRPPVIFVIYFYFICLMFMSFFMLFVFIYAYWCPTQFPCNMMFVIFYSNTTDATTSAETANPSGTPGFFPWIVCGVRVATS